MGGEMRKLEVCFTTRDCSQAPPLPNGETAYSDDISDLLRVVIEKAVMEWYEREGEPYLRCEPMVG